MEPSNIDEFDRLLLKTIDDVLKECLGDANVQIVYGYLEKRSCPMLEIPQKLEVFSRELRMLLGSGRGQILGSGAILEETIVEVLCHKLGVTPNLNAPVRFAECVRKLKKISCLAKRLREATQGPPSIDQTGPRFIQRELKKKASHQLE